MVAAPPGLQRGHQQGQQQPGGQDAEDASEAVQVQRAALWLGVGVALQVAAAFLWPPLLFEDVQVAFFLQLQNPAEIFALLIISRLGVRALALPVITPRPPPPDACVNSARQFHQTPADPITKADSLTGGKLNFNLHT